MNQRLHIGCGNDYREGFVNVDRGDCVVDVQHDLNVTPYPFDDNSFSLIIANQTLEHLEQEKWFDIIGELYRISAPGCLWEFRSPYALSENFATDPTHRMPLARRSFHYFDSGTTLGTFGRIYGVEPRLRVLTARLIPGDRYGRDVYHRILVDKGGDLRVPAKKELPSHLFYERFPGHGWVRAGLRRVPGGEHVRRGLKRLLDAFEH